MSDISKLKFSEFPEETALASTEARIFLVGVAPDKASSPKNLKISGKSLFKARDDAHAALATEVATHKAESTQKFTALDKKDTELAAAIAAEEKRATDAESSIRTQITTETSRLDAANTTLTNNLSAHTGNSSIHVTANEKAAWNANVGTVVKELVSGNFTFALASEASAASEYSYKVAYVVNGSADVKMTVSNAYLDPFTLAMCSESDRASYPASAAITLPGATMSLFDVLKWNGATFIKFLWSAPSTNFIA